VARQAIVRPERFVELLFVNILVTVDAKASIRVFEEEFVGWPWRLDPWQGFAGGFVTLFAVVSKLLVRAGDVEAGIIVVEFGDVLEKCGVVAVAAGNGKEFFVKLILVRGFVTGLAELLFRAGEFVHLLAGFKVTAVAADFRVVTGEREPCHGVVVEGAPHPAGATLAKNHPAISGVAS